ncbi:TPA: EpsG family protein [Vibrio parahaemolyticus]|nr:EpsG family protein [Vibrio parahaemolyticus]HBC3604841.1 EpsG family protein [Vibrio parahaemolyticus]HBC3977287.1 EpsG family protein [Vibrio parahaemolyticus]HCE2152445.1 EpsG family protein [Vibrio parahaemolyticus]HCG7214105.1 EpsG family protein [Vibrio parahaemolyticus]
MDIYLLLIFFSFFCLMIVCFVKELDLLISSVFIIILFIVAGLRYDVGTDFSTYVYFINLINNGHDTYMESGFELMIKLLLDSGFEEQSVFFVSSLITITFFYFFIIKHSEQYTFSVIIFFLFPIFYLASFNGVRQFIAISIFLYSIRFILEKKLTSYCIIIVVGSFFHKTILLMLPLYFILNKRLGVKKTILTSILFVSFVSFLPFIGRALGFPEKYFTDVLVTEGINYKALVFPCIFIIYCFFETKCKEKCNDKNITYNMLFIGSLISITPLISSLPSAPVIRMSSYFTPVIIIFFSNFSFVFVKSEIRVIYYLLVVLLSVLYFYSTVFVAGERYNLVPYFYNLRIF